MKKINYLLAAALFIAAGCEKSPVDQGTTDEGNVYMQFSVKMLSTRSQTDNEGEGNSNSDATPDTEVGLAKENTISTVDIVLVGSNTVKATNVTPVAADGSTYVAKFDKKTIAAGKYDVYIYANCTSPETFAIDQTSDADVSAMTQDNKFWMTNAYATANPVVVSFVSYIGVFFNALWGFVIFGEILTGLTVAGGVLIIGGSMYLTKLKHDKIAEMAKMQERK